MRLGNVITMFLAALILVSCSSAGNLTTSYFDDYSAIEGTFDVVYYGNRYHNDNASIVILDIAGDDYTFMPHDLKEAYRTENGVPAPDALVKARRFLRQHTYYESSKYRTIHAPDGTLVGYEIMPTYELLTYPHYRRVTTNYYIEDGKTIKVIVRESHRGGYNNLQIESR